jgi:hypothetical protein
MGTIHYLTWHQCPLAFSVGYIIPDISGQMLPVAYKMTKGITSSKQFVEWLFILVGQYLSAQQHLI